MTRAPHLPSSLLVLLAVAWSVPATAQTEPYCATRNTYDDGTPTEPTYQSVSQYMGDSVAIVADSDSDPLQGDGLAEGKLIDGLNGASNTVNGGCQDNYIPTFSVNESGMRGADPDFTTTRTTLGIDYRRNEVAPTKDGSVRFAEWTQELNPSGTARFDTIVVYGKCPGNTQGLPDFCVGPTGNQDIDWSTQAGIDRLAHEVFHALGLGHDQTGGDCSTQNGLMRDPLFGSPQVKSYHCQLADHLNCEGGNCPPDPEPCPLTSPITSASSLLGTKVHCLPDDPTGHLPDRCERVPELCRDGGPNPWWLITETKPECGFRMVPGPEETLQLVRVCEFPAKSAIVYRDLTETPGPTTTLLSPAPGAFVRGIVPIDGWMRQDAVGVTGTLGFWLDQQHLYPTGVSYGDSESSACSGSTDPNCPYVGFSATLDTTTLADGAHTLEMMGAEAVADYPTPAYGRTTFTVDNTRPTAAITSPANGATISGTTQVTVAASDNLGVDVVSFHVDGVYKATDKTAPFTYSFDTTQWADGTHTVRARVWDRAGNGRNAQISVVIANDLQAPQVSLTKPAAGSLKRGNVTVEAQASDDQGVSYVEFYVDGAHLATDPTAPYRVTWSTTGYADGAHSLTARAFDASGKVGVSPAVGVTVDNTIPKMYVDAPSHVQVVSGTSVRVAGWAIDASGIASRTFKIDGQPLTLNGGVAQVNRGPVCTNHPDVPDPGCPYVGWRAYFDSTRYANGSHTLTVTAFDAAGNAKAFNRTFIIQNSYTATFNPVADASAYQGYPTYNDGTSVYLATRTTSGGYGAYAFLKFQVSGILGQVTSARLQVRTASSMNELWLYWLVHSNWTESNLTWSYFPGPGGDLDHTYNLVSGAWYSFDVSSFVTGNGTYSMGFANTNPYYAYLYSRQSSYPPVLEVTYIP